jgi:hypothetical protein
MEGEAFASFCADIQAQGLRQAIVLYEGKIFDGCNHYRACQATGTPYHTTEYDGTDPIGYVVSLNLERCHLSESQRAMVAAKLATLGRGNPASANQYSNGNAQICAFPLHTTDSTPVITQEAAARLNVSRRTVQQACKVMEETAPEMAQPVEAGAMTVSAALPLTELPED